MLSWSYTDAPGMLAERVGASPAQKVYTAVGGETPQRLVNETSQAIAEGRTRIALLAGCEAMASRRLARKLEVTLDWERGTPEQVIGDNRLGFTETESRHGAVRPTSVYPLFENALRAHLGQSIDEHQQYVGELCSRFTQVAARQSLRVVPGGADGGGDRRRRAEEPVDLLPVPEDDERDHGGRPGGGRDHDRLGDRPRAGHPRGQVGLRPRLRRGERQLVRERPGELPQLARDQGQHLARARHGWTHRRRHRLLRPVLVLPVRRAVRARRARPPHGRPARPHGHRRPAVRGRPGQQLRHALDRDDCRAPAARIRSSARWSPASAGSRRSTRPAYTAAALRRADGRAPSRRSTRRSSTHSPVRRSPASRAARLRSRRTRSSSTATESRRPASSSGGWARAERFFANTPPDADLLWSMTREEFIGREGAVSYDAETQKSTWSPS